MNCKPGDLAINVAGFPQLRGEIYLVLRPYDGPRLDIMLDLVIWIVESRGKEWWCSDRSLRPIRPDGITTEEVKELFSPSPAKESEKV